MRDTNDENRRGEVPVSGDAGVGIGSASSHARIHRFSHEAMATVFEVHADHSDARYAAQAAQAAFDLADRLERELSRFQPTSDITRINHLGAVWGGWAAGRASENKPSVNLGGPSNVSYRPRSS